MVKVVKNTITSRLALGFAAAMTVHGAIAQTADFTLYNDVRAPIIGFYTQRADKSWSANWLSSPLAMGQNIGLTFAKNCNNIACVTRLPDRYGR
jgi:hypothetical protein